MQGNVSHEQALNDRITLTASVKCLSDRLSRGEPLWFSEQEIAAVHRYVPGVLDGQESNTLFNVFYIGVAAGIASICAERKRPIVRHRDRPKKTRQVDMNDEDT